MNSLKHIDSHMDDLISDLQRLIRQPSVSAKNEGIEECAVLVKTILQKIGIKSELLRLKKGVAPIVFGEIKSKQNPSKTLLFYNHYDVQPQNRLICGMILLLVEKEKETKFLEEVQLMIKVN